MNVSGKRITIPKDRPYWFLGAYFSQDEDQTERFLKEGIWEKEREDKYNDLVREIQPGDRVAIKATYTKKRGLPFEHEGPAVSVMAIKAIGTVLANPGDGRRVKVEWQERFDPPKEWYFFTGLAPVWKVWPTDWCREELCRFAFFGEPQDIDRFRNDPLWRDRYGNESKVGAALGRLLDGIADAAGLSGRAEAAQLLLDREPWKEISSRRELFAAASEALSRSPVDLEGLRRCFAKVNLMGSASSNSMLSTFFRHPEARDWLTNLAGRGVVSAADLDRMIDELTGMGFSSGNDGKPRRAEAARFLSLLLAALDPDEYMEYRETHAGALAKWLGDELRGQTHGERMMALRDIYRAIRASAEFQEYFAGEREFPNAVVGALAWILKDGGKAFFNALKAGVKPGESDLAEQNEERRVGTTGLPGNLLLYGPPGTGKTYHTIFKAVEICDGVRPPTYREAKERFEQLKDEGRVEFVTFHQSYGYEEFIEGIRPVTRDGKVSYEVRDGLLKRLCQEARARAAAGNFVLIIDEINRGNVSKIFGELITLVEDDKRIGAEHGMLVRLPLSGDVFGVPKNLYIIGTMNTADRSIAMMDTALRRRFVFEEMMPDPSLLDDVNVAGIDVGRMLRTMNRRIEVLYDREHTIGHAYFLPLKENPALALLASIFEHKIIPLLAEYFFENWGRIRLVLGDNQNEDQRFAFIMEERVDGQNSLFGDGFPDDVDWDERRLHRRNPEALIHPESYIGIYDPARCATAPGEREVPRGLEADE